jgi:hypothetical protein
MWGEEGFEESGLKLSCKWMVLVCAAVAAGRCPFSDCCIAWLEQDAPHSKLSDENPFKE